MTFLKHDIEYFNKGKLEIEKYWERLSGKPDFTNACVLDVGCGHGRLCIDVALSGAKKVIGLDIDSHRIDFASKNLQKNYKHISHIIHFENANLMNYDNIIEFDYILSKDSFEHIIDLDSILIEMKNRLKKNGNIYIGFGPLYNSFDHKRTRAIIPWGHLIIPESFLLRRVSMRKGKKIHSVEELGLNKLSLKEYKKYFSESGLSIQYFKVNCSNNPIMKIFSLIRKFPGLKEYFSYNLYCILQK